MDKKYCLGCNKNIDICLFSLNNKEIDGYQNRCKNCKKIQYYISLSKKDKWYLKFIKEFNLDFINNKNEFLIKIKQFSKWKWENIKQTDDYKLLNKQRREKNKEQVKQNNKKRYKEDILYQNSIKNNVKEWEEKNKKKKNQRRKNRYNNDLDFKLKLNLRNYFNISLKTIPKKSSILDLIGCSVENLKLHLENQFLNGMTWENWGEIWEIDHIKPVSSFNFIEESQQKECFHYTNLQPLYKTTEISNQYGCVNCIGNRNKSNKL